MFIEIEIKKKIFPKRTIFLGAGIEIEKGEFIAIKGQSGIGKSTLIKMIGLLEGFDGHYNFQGTEITKKNREEIRASYFAYLFQEPMLIPFYTVYENVIMPLKNLKLSISERDVDDILKELNLSYLKHSNVETLSGGEAVRVAIARALISNRPIIIADEPTGNLDYENALGVMNILKAENEKGKTIILVTHSNEFDSFYSRIINIDKNKVIG